jgi:hypothetical protein
MEEMLQGWVSHSEEEDVTMVDANPGSESQVAVLIKQLELYNSRIQDNPWLKSMIQSL